MLKHADGFVMKPVQKDKRGKTEIEFYEQVSHSTHPVVSQLQNLIPRFLGIHKFALNNAGIISFDPYMYESNVWNVFCKYTANYFLKMEDIAAGSAKPCIADIKIGMYKDINVKETSSLTVKFLYICFRKSDMGSFSIT